MGQKVSPVGLRVGVNRNWDSRWYANDQDFAGLLHEDIKVRDYILKKLKTASVATKPNSPNDTLSPPLVLPS